MSNKKENTKIMILGQEYEIIDDYNLCKKNNADGLCNYYNKTIKIIPENQMFDNDMDVTDEMKSVRYNEVLRHEIIHAFFEESGLDNYSNDERLVDWIAKQYHKIKDAFDMLDI